MKKIILSCCSLFYSGVALGSSYTVTLLEENVKEEQVAKMRKVEGSLSDNSGYIDWSSKMIASAAAVRNLDALLSSVEDHPSDSKQKTIKSLDQFIDALKRKRVLELNFSDNRLRDKGVHALADELHQHSELKIVSIANNDVGNKSIKYLLSKIISFPELQYVDIRENFGANTRCIREFRESLPATMDDSQKDLLMSKIIWQGDQEISWKHR